MYLYPGYPSKLACSELGCVCVATYVHKRTHKKLNPTVHSVYSYIANSVYGTAQLLARTVPASKNTHISFAQP